MNTTDLTYGFDDAMRDAERECRRIFVNATTRGWRDSGYASAREAAKVLAGSGANTLLIDLVTARLEMEQDDIDASAMAEAPVDGEKGFEIQLDSAVGPRVLFCRGTDLDDLEAALPAGWSVDWSNQVPVHGYDYSAPLVQEEDNEQ